jgi:hypothetical protein
VGWKSKSSGALYFDSKDGNQIQHRLVQISFSDRLIRIAVVKNKSTTGQIAISPVGTAENSPGRTRISCVACWRH